MRTVIEIACGGPQRRAEGGRRARRLPGAHRRGQRAAERVRDRRRGPRSLQTRRRSTRSSRPAATRARSPGVPLGVKDLEDCAGLPTTHGSLLYKDDPAKEHDSIHVARLRAAGAVPIGKTAAPEFGTVAFTHTKAWGTTRNPWDTDEDAGRIERRICRRGRGRSHAVVHGERRRRVDPHPGGVHRSRRDEAELRPHPASVPLGLADECVRRAHDHRRRRRPPPRRRGRPRRRRSHDAPSAAACSTSRPSRRSTCPACATGGRRTSASASVDPELAEVTEAAARDLFTVVGQAVQRSEGRPHRAGAGVAGGGRRRAVARARARACGPIAPGTSWVSCAAATTSRRR